MRMIVETSGPFMIINPFTREEIEADRPCVVSAHAFITEKLGSGALKLHAADLPDTATDPAWLAWLKASDGKIDLAVASFVSSFEAKSEPTKKK